MTSLCKLASCAAGIFFIIIGWAFMMKGSDMPLGTDKTLHLGIGLILTAHAAGFFVGALRSD